MNSFRRPGGPTVAVRRGASSIGDEDVKSNRVGPCSRRSWKESWRRWGSEGLEGGVAVANVRAELCVQRGFNIGDL